MKREKRRVHAANQGVARRPAGAAPASAVLHASIRI
eukprot:COSAG01_NODE_40750_length_460_cov_0.703601_1_plen_35_part_10